jgi:hypothetical protein
VRRDLWSSFSVFSSSLRTRELDEADMAFEVGSRWRGRRVKLSRSSMVEGKLFAEKKNLEIAPSGSLGGYRRFFFIDMERYLLFFGKMYGR